MALALVVALVAFRADDRAAMRAKSLGELGLTAQFCRPPNFQNLHDCHPTEKSAGACSGTRESPAKP